MQNLQVNIILSLILSIAFFIAFFATLRLHRQRGLVHLGAVYALSAALWLLVSAAAYQGLLKEIVPEVVMALPPVLLVFLALIFLAWCTTFLPNTPNRLAWIGIGVFLFLSLLVVASRVIKFPDEITINNSIVLPYKTQIYGLAWMGWGLIVLSTVWMTWISFLHTHQPMHRNRIGYWALALACVICADILGFLFQPALSGAIRLTGFLLAIYVATIHNLVDLSHVALRMIIFAIIALLGIVVYTVAFSLVGPVLFRGLENSPIITGMLLGLLAVLLSPILITADGFLRRFAYGINDQTRTVREYSLGISNILDLERLAEMALGFIQRRFSTSHAYLLLVDRPPGGMVYNLRPVPISGGKPPPAGSLEPDSPFVTFFWQTNRPLTQYDIDLLSQFRGMSLEERHWLEVMHVDVFVPVFSKGDWIGLFALGSKLTGERYYDEDLYLLATLADQTAVALENARLFDDMTRLNRDLQQTQSALQDANRKLREVDSLKSTFVGVVTHEMRTPLANLAFSLQLLQLYGTENLLAEQREQVGMLERWMKVSRDMVENLITFASFFSNKVDLNFEQLDFREVIFNVLQNLQFQANEKSVQIRTSYAGEDFSLNADRKLMNLALTQIVQNAIKFNKEEGQVWLACWTTNNTLFVDVQDTGIGIPTDHLDAIWNGFSQVKDPLRRGVEGLGLGLALVKFIVIAHNGKVWVESEEGKGSAIGFQVPRLGSGRLTEPLTAHRPRNPYHAEKI